MSDLVRFGIAIEGALLDIFDRHITRRGYANRSEAIRDLVRAELARDAWERGERAVATISLIYDHHVRELTERLIEIQHDHGDRVISATHVHLDHDHCLEVILAQGPANELKRMADQLIGAKGVIAGDVTGLKIVGVAGKKKPKRGARAAGAQETEGLAHDEPRPAEPHGDAQHAHSHPHSHSHAHDHAHEHPHAHPHTHGDEPAPRAKKGERRARRG